MHTSFEDQQTQTNQLLAFMASYTPTLSVKPGRPVPKHVGILMQLQVNSPLAEARPMALYCGHFNFHLQWKGSDF